jgi:MtN3 and saliva related transmembrane protein
VFAWTTIIATAAGVFTTFANVPQVLKCWRTGNTRDLSAKMLVALSFGLALWVVYGWLHGDTAVAISNAAGLGLSLTLLILKARSRLYD